MIDNEEILNYLSSNPVAKLQLGCGTYTIDGWLNTDERRYGHNVVELNVCKPFPIPDNSFDYIFSEHLFEHLTYRDGKNMLKECYRILKPNGIMRLSTPNLQFLIDLYLHPEKEINKAYIEFDGRRTGQPSNPVYAISHFHTDWGHKVIYDPESLTTLLEETGFRNIYQCEIGKSEYDELNDIEQHSRQFKNMGCEYDYNILQSMIFEAQK